MKNVIAGIVLFIGLIPWRFQRRILKKQPSVTEYYYLMRLFKRLFGKFYVWIEYPNLFAEGHTLFVHLDVCENSQQLIFRAREKYELEEISSINVGMKFADCFLDIGANVGVFALTIAQNYPDKKVVGFEPVKKSYDCFIENIAANQLPNCSVEMAAISNTGKPIRFYFNPLNDGGGSLVPFEAYRTGDVEINAIEYQKNHPEFQPFIDVKTIRLDDLVTSKTVLKVDVEGAEADVLQSGQAAFEKGLIDLMVVEVTVNTIDAVVEFLEPFGFELYLFPNFRRVEVGMALTKLTNNLVCVQKDTKSSIAWKQVMKIDPPKNL